jgi:hypothetical protein
VLGADVGQMMMDESAVGFCGCGANQVKAYCGLFQAGRNPGDDVAGGPAVQQFGQQFGALPALRLSLPLKRRALEGRNCRDVLQSGESTGLGIRAPQAQQAARDPARDRHGDDVTAGDIRWRVRGPREQFLALAGECGNAWQQ